MNERQEQLIRNVDKNKQLILDAEQYIWKHPQTGYTEWDAHNYLVEKYEALGYKLVLAGKIPGFGDIPGFYTDVDTGRPGPTLAIFGELDALDIANHPESVNGMPTAAAITRSLLSCWAWRLPLRNRARWTVCAERSA